MCTMIEAWMLSTIHVIPVEAIDQRLDYEMICQKMIKTRDQKESQQRLLIRNVIRGTPSKDVWLERKQIKEAIEMLSMILGLDGWRCLIRRKAETKCRRKMHVPIECNWNQQDCLVRMSGSSAERRILNLTIGLVEVTKA